jgi:hypothetical protein
MADMKFQDTVNPCRLGNSVIVLTPSYHWTGKIVEMHALSLVLEDAMMFVEIGQIADACKGEFQNAHGDPIPDGQRVAVPSPPSSQVIDFVGDLPRKRLSGN